MPPGLAAIALPADRASLLHSPSINVSKVYSTLSCGSILSFLIPGITNGFLILSDSKAPGTGD